MDMWAMFKIRSNVALQHDLCDKTSSLAPLVFVASGACCVVWYSKPQVDFEYRCRGTLIVVSLPTDGISAASPPCRTKSKHQILFVTVHLCDVDRRNLVDCPAFALLPAIMLDINLFRSGAMARMCWKAALFV